MPKFIALCTLADVRTRGWLGCSVTAKEESNSVFEFMYIMGVKGDFNYVQRLSYVRVSLGLTG